MRDKGAVKVICRIITLIQYVLIVFVSFILPDFLLDDIVLTILENIKTLIVILSAIILLMMIETLIIKYTMKDLSKITPYRITDVIIRAIFTLPATFIILTYVLKNFWNADNIQSLAAGAAIFFIIDNIIKFTLQETMNVSFITSDNL